ncbi:threonine-phosphate decarboxylase CobD [Paenibacillus roseipurpureus]|uniref:threonine-phosphate decarboxylase n=1 Tax=Paenibacillus roseopurpureus TaxID=2918901 RepID=A0AA96LM90_9BACL|nr:threonine-phosphate decarboxylase CobD [Paenibacillus sp. MBLB1832]WNR43589.1 threonine-phosphate decarboxylase CobD [Paenibacillus sp. MBLB1832]
MLERYGHGGDLWTAEEAFGRPKEQFLDYSSNMNPLGPPEVVKQILQESWRDIVKYPDPVVRELTQKLAAKYDIDPASILVGNGAAELIDLIVRVLQPATTGLARPSFSEYEEAVHKSGGGIVNIPLFAQHQFELQWSDVEARLADVDLFFLGHPNNPTGKLLPSQVIQGLLQSNRHLVLDEAFMDFVPKEREHSMLQLASRTPKLTVIRSMTKFYSIPGIRLGFIVAHPDLIARMCQLQVQWSVNYLAQRMGSAVVEEEVFEQSTKAWLRVEKPWLIEQLRQLGLEVVPSEVNFLLFSFPEAFQITVKDAQRYMGHQGILIRDASLFEGLDDRYCRIAIRLRADNERLLLVLRQFIEQFTKNGGVTRA